MLMMLPSLNFSDRFAAIASVLVSVSLLCTPCNLVTIVVSGSTSFQLNVLIIGTTVIKFCFKLCLHARAISKGLIVSSTHSSKVVATRLFGSLLKLPAILLWPLTTLTWLCPLNVALCP